MSDMLTPETPGMASPTPAGTPARTPSPAPAQRGRGGRPNFPQKGGQRPASLASKEKESILLGEAGFGRRKSGMNRRHFDKKERTSPPPPVPALRPGSARIVTLGGLDGIGINCHLIEYGEDIILIDIGLKFPEEGLHGIDYTIPDVGYLKGKEKNIRAVIATHGHLDHIGGIPHIMPRLGTQIPIYGLPLTAALIMKRQDEFPDTLNVQVVQAEDVIQHGQFRIEFFRVNHNIPDSMAVAVTTPVGTIVNTGDWKIDYSPVNEKPIDLPRVAEVGRKGVIAAMVDSTSAGFPGYQISESQIMKNLEDIFLQAEGRIITATFSSLLSRMQQIITLSARTGRKIVIDGRSMRENIAIASNLHYMNVPPGTIIDAKEMHRYEPKELTILSTGAQGERFSALGRIARGEHASITIEPGDTVVFSSSNIPGNEAQIQTLMDLLYRQKANVIHYRQMDIHSGGHAKAEETKLMLQLLKPKVFIPIHGSHSHLVMASQLGRQVGFVPGETSFVLDNGSVMDFHPDGTVEEREERASHDLIAVDGLGVGDVGEAVLHDRELMGSDGIFLVLVRIDREGALRGTDVISRGFVYMHGNDELMTSTKGFIQKVCLEHKKLAKEDQKEFKFILQRELEKFLFAKTEREPVVIPIVTAG